MPKRARRTFGGWCVAARLTRLQNEAVGVQQAHQVFCQLSLVSFASALLFPLSYMSVLSVSPLRCCLRHLPLHSRGPVNAGCTTLSIRVRAACPSVCSLLATRSTSYWCCSVVRLFFSTARLVSVRPALTHLPSPYSRLAGA